MLRIAVTAVMLLFTAPALSATTSSAATRALARAGLDQDALKTPTGRIALVSAVRAYCSEIEAVYPRNSPEEEAWLVGEGAGDGDRAYRAIASPEMGRRQAKFFVDGCERYTADLDKMPDRSKLFVALGYAFIRFSGDAAFYAQKNNIDADRFGLPSVLRETVEALLLAALMASQ